MGKVLTNDQIVEYELEVFKHIQRHCIYRVRYKYGECNLLNSKTGEPTSQWQMYCIIILQDCYL